MGIVSKIQQFGRGIKTIPLLVKEDEEAIAARARVVLDMTTGANKHEVRRLMIKNIERDYKGWAKKGGKDKIDAEIKKFMSIPDCKLLLQRLNMNESHLRVLENQALKKYRY